jgi:arylsulfatase A-like enzyme
MPCLDAPLDVIVFLLDDMRFDQVAYLEETTTRLEPEAVTYDRAYVTTPMCCPERASFLSGGWYAWQTGVLSNDAPVGGAPAFDDTRTLPTRLQEAGYHTALLGKYLNEYDSLGNYVPPGWSTWAATGDSGGWVDFDIRVGSTGPDAPGVATVQHVDDYVTDWQTRAALDELSTTTDPLFLYVSYLAPHHPHVPADADRDAFPGYVYRDRAYDEADVSDKPAWIQALPQLNATTQATADSNNRERIQSLLAVDRSMAGIIDAVRASDRADRTVFVLTSDNGQQWFEHRIGGKGVAYEESVRVPLLIAQAGQPPETVSGLVAMNLDLAATVQALAGLAGEGEGIVLPAVCDEPDAGRDVVVLQGWPGDTPGWAGLVTDTEKYIETIGGDVELYDLVADPYEETSLHAEASAEHLDALATRLAEDGGLVVSTTTLPDARRGEPYSAVLVHWGGEDPVTWEISSGALPAGLTLGADGEITGTPTAIGEAIFGARVTDSSVSPVYGGPQTWTSSLTLRVAPSPRPPASEGGCGCGGDGGAALLVVLPLATRRRGRSRPVRGPGG